MENKIKAEILAPCKNFETLTAAVRSGCNAVYVGEKSFSARAAADNFTFEEIKQAAKFCHRHGVKIYQALNTIFTDSETSLVISELQNACEAGLDGIIVQDLGVFELAKRLCPTLPLHASTQMSIHTPCGALFAKKMGAVRVVLARELSKAEIKTICGFCQQNALETEVFVHGALCMCLSGQCYLSALIGGRSANRGRCAQACRLPFSNLIPEKKGGSSHALSLKDMSLVPFLSELQEMGVTSLKIEGRMKRPEYVAAATDACKKALSGENYDMSVLEGVFSRSGFTSGYYTAKRLDMFGIRRKEDVESANGLLKPLSALYENEIKISPLRFSVKIKSGKACELTAKDDINEVKVEGEIPEKALKREINLEFVERQLKKLGDTIYEFDGVSGEIESGLAVSAGALNDLRRRAVEELLIKREQFFTRKIPFDKQLAGELAIKKADKRADNPNREIFVCAERAATLRGLDFNRLTAAFLPLEEIKNIGGLDSEKLGIRMPEFCANEEELVAETLEISQKYGIKKVLCANLSHIEIAKKLGLIPYGGYSLNVANSFAVEALKKQGVENITLSVELKFSKVNEIRADDVKLGVVGFGRLPLMTMRNCPISDCSRCKGELSDRTGRNFFVRCVKNRGFYQLLNADTLYTADKLSGVRCDFVWLYFDRQTTAEAADIFEDFIKNKPFSQAFTRGLYFRGMT